MFQLIVAGNFRQAEEYAYRNKLHQKDWTYVDEIYRIYGMRNCQLILVGTYQHNRVWKDYRFEIQDYCKSHEIEMV